MVLNSEPRVRESVGRDRMLRKIGPAKSEDVNPREPAEERSECPVAARNDATVHVRKSFDT